MNRRRCAVAILAASVCVHPALADGVRLLFGGDVMPARGVEAEAAGGRTTPLRDLHIPGPYDLFMANLEGAAGRAADCVPAPRDPCLAIPDNGFRLLEGSGIGALSLANNHAGDTGAEGRRRTAAALEAIGIVPVASSEQPAFIRAGGLTVGIVALNMVPPRDQPPDIVPSPEVARRIRLAAAFSDVAVAFVHWGAELRDWPQPSQQATAQWLVAQGVDLIVGAHPHVAIAPDCPGGVPVFWSLGNLVFDQADPESRRGMIADCRVWGGVLACSAIATGNAPGSSFPHVAGAEQHEVPACRRRLSHGIEAAGQKLRANTSLHGAMTIDGYAANRRVWSVPVRAAVVSAALAELSPGEPASLVMLQRAPSRIDGEDGLRVFVYRIGPRGLEPRWRGSALGWPLDDIHIQSGNPDLVCGLHRTDSFLTPDAAARAHRVAAWRWNGFGFSLDEADAASCQARAEHR